MADLRRAVDGDAPALTALTRASKAHWGYPRAWLDHWADELSVAPAGLHDVDAWVACDESGEITGWCRLRVAETSDVSYVDDLFVDPDAIGSGVGRRLLTHAVERARAFGCAVVELDADPHAEGFYAHEGFERIGGKPADFDRVLPVMLRVVGPRGPVMERLDDVAPSHIDELVALHLDAIAGGASVGFLADPDPISVRDEWASTASSVAEGKTVLLATRDRDGVIVGSVQLVLEQRENGRFRGDVRRVLVHRRARRRGLGGALLQACERAAVARGRTLLLLDTRSGSDGDRLYQRQGWRHYGTIPGYALGPDGRPDEVVFYYLDLTAAGALRPLGVLA
jgi:GNAT superfamily N-acetyltransferase